MVLDLFKKFTTLWIILFVLAFFPIFTSTFDLPFWNDVVMRIMLLGMAAMGLNIVLGLVGWFPLVMLLLWVLVPTVLE